MHAFIHSFIVCLFIILKDFFIERERERERDRETETQREKQAPCREPDVGLDPGTPGSHPGPKAGTLNPEPPRVSPCHSICKQRNYIVSRIGYYQMYGFI